MAEPQTSWVGDELLGLPWGDVHLSGFQWTEGGRDLAFSLLFPSGGPVPDRAMTLRCRWAGDLRVDLQGDGFPLSWNVTFTRIERGWKVLFDFASTGFIAVDCSGLELTPE